MSEKEMMEVAWRQCCVLEEILREILYDKIEEAEEELSKATFAVYDDYTEDGDGNSVGIIYPENVDDELDTLVFEVFELGLKIKEMTDAL